MWATRRRVGNGVKQRSIELRTVDISVEGAKVLVPSKHYLPKGASVRIEFHGDASAARVLESIKIDDATQMLRLTFEHPSQNFMRTIEEWLASGGGGRKFVEGSWLGESA